MKTSPPPSAELRAFSGGLESRALLAGMTFLEMTASPSVDHRTMAWWFDEHVAATTTMARPALLIEPPTGSVLLQPRSTALATAQAQLFARLVATARTRVLAALQGFVSSPSDDRFLRAAIHLGRVRREGGRWVAHPEPTAPLSGVVLSLFAVTMLTDRDIYDSAFCVCETCWSISFDGRESMRHACSAHAPRASVGPYLTTFPSTEQTYAWR